MQYPACPGRHCRRHRQQGFARTAFKDTIAAGKGLCDEEAVRILTPEAPDRIADLVRLGVPFDTLDGKMALTMEAAHSVPRILHAGGDATGEHIEVTLSHRVARLRSRFWKTTWRRKSYWKTARSRASARWTASPVSKN